MPLKKVWIPAFAGMTNSMGFQLFTISSIFDHCKGVTETLHQKKDYLFKRIFFLTPITDPIKVFSLFFVKVG